MEYSLQIVQTGCIQEESFYIIYYISQYSQNPDFGSMKFIIITQAIGLYSKHSTLYEYGNIQIGPKEVCIKLYFYLFLKCGYMLIMAIPISLLKCCMSFWHIEIIYGVMIEILTNKLRLYR